MQGRLPRAGSHMRAERGQGVADEQQLVVEEGGARGGDVGDGLDEGGDGFVDELGEGGGEDLCCERFLGGPDGGRHFAHWEGDAVAVGGGVRHYGCEFRRGGRVVRVPDVV